LHAYSHQGRPNNGSITRSKELTVFLDGKIKQIEKEIIQFVDSDKDLNARMAYLSGIPGAGVTAAATVVAGTNGFAAIKSIRQLSSYAGLDARINESGKWKGKSTISKRGNSHIRKALFFPAISHKKHDKSAGQFYDRIKAKKGIGMVATVAVERKLLGLMFSLWKNKQMFRKTL